MAKKEPLYPHNPELRLKGFNPLPSTVTGPASLKKWAAGQNKERRVSKISARDGRIVRQEIYNISEIDETLRAYFNIGAKKITIQYDNLNVEWALVPE